MANLPQQPVWVDGIYQLETSDPVLAGPGGIDNLQATQLGDRTAYLKQEVDAIKAGLEEQAEDGDPFSQYLKRDAVAADAGPLAWLGAAAGTANALQLALPEGAVVPAYKAGQRFQFKATASNTGAVTAKVGGLAAKAIKKGGDTGLVDLDSGDIKPGAVYDLNYDGSVFQLGGGVGGAGKAFERFSFSANVAQTDFECPHPVGTTIVLRNGREVRNFASDGVKITLPPCDFDDAIEILAFRTFKVADHYTKAEVLELLKTASALPVGVLVDFPVDISPAGFLEAENETVYSGAEYPELYAVYGTKFNRGGEPAGFFRLPETRGEFMRGWDHGRGVDLGRQIGSYQLGAIQSHDHVSGSYGSSYGSGSFAYSGVGMSAAGDVVWSNTKPTGGTETRPRSLAVKRMVKAWHTPVNQGAIDVAALAAKAQNVIASQFGGYTNLRGWASGTSSILSYLVDEILLRGADGQYQRFNDLSISINLATNGLNGLDTGAVAASSWYSTWAVWNPATGEKGGIAAVCPVLSGSTTAGSAVVTGLVSTAGLRAGLPFMGGSFPAGVVIKSVDGPTQITASRPATAAATVSLCFLVDPALPAGFTHKARVGMARTDATANKFPLGFEQFGRLVQYRLAAGSNVAAVLQMAAGVLASWTAVAVVNCVPPTAARIRGHVFQSPSNATSFAAVAPNNAWATSGSNTPNGGYGNIGVPSNGDYGSFSFDFLLESANVFFGSSGAANSLHCVGYEDSL